jgi:hypothetical protein
MSSNPQVEAHGQRIWQYMNSYHAHCGDHIKMQENTPISSRYKMEMGKAKDRKKLLIGKLL